MNINVKRFWSRVVVTDDDSCWLWKTKEVYDSYGYFYVEGKNYYSHRISWIIAYGEVPNGLNVLHKCDNKRCVRPSHLYVGTQHENMLDVWERNRVPIVDRQGQVKIREMYATGKYTQYQLADMFGVSQMRIRVILQGV